MNLLNQDKKTLFCLLFLFILSLWLKLPSFWQNLPPYSFCDEDIFVGYSYNMHVADKLKINSYLAPALNFKLPVWGARLTKTFGVKIEGLSDYLIHSRILLNGVLSSLSIFMMFVLSFSLFKRKYIALLTSSLFAVSPYVLAHGSYAYPDHFIIFFSSVTTYYCLKIFQENRLKNYILAGLFMGITFSTKYSGIFFVFPIIISHFLYIRKNNPALSFKNAITEKFTYLFFSAAIFILIFAALNDAAVGHPQNFIKDFLWNNENYQSIRAGKIPANGFLFYLKTLFVLPTGILAFLFLVYTSIKDKNLHTSKSIIFLSMPCLLIFSIGRYPRFFVRNMVILLPFILPYLAYSLVYVSERMSSGITSKRIKAFIQALIILVSLSFPLYKTIQMHKSFHLIDSRVMAENWINKHLKGKVVGGFSGCYYPSPAKQEGIIYREISHSPDVSSKTCVQYIITDERVAPQQYLREDPWYFYTNPYLNNFHFTNPGNSEYPIQRKKLKKYFADFERIKSFNGFGPVVEVYKNKNDCFFN